MSTATVTIGGRYRLLDVIGAGGMGRVYRAYDRITREIVALKRIEARTDQIQFSSYNTERMTSEQAYLSIASEFRLLATLRHPNIISVLDYGFDTDRSPYYTMEWVEGSRTIMDAAQADLLTRARLLIETLQALAYLHRRQILHCDLKPGNILLTGEQRVRVMDFGLAREQVTIQGDTEYPFFGTLGYIAPEIFGGSLPTPSTDLYAVGMVAFELLSGVPLKPSHDIAHYLRLEPEHEPAYHLLPERVRSVVMRWTARAPEHRPQSAEIAIRELCAAMGIDEPPEDREVRDSYLMGAPFVGRKQELSLLTDALDAAIAGQGSAWLVAGESGVGKTRLLEEVRIRGLVKGALVLNAQGTATMLFSYHLWRQIVPGLALRVPLEESEVVRLRPLYPYIDKILERPQPAEPLARHTQIAHHGPLVEALVDLLKRQPQPVVLLLEDLHRLDESLIVLRDLLPLVGDLPLLIIGTYRTDEAPHFAEQLALMRPINLERLTRDEIRQLSQYMLGHVGESLLTLIDRETEGNILFIVELLRALADRSGRLTSIEETPLPQRVVAVGITRILQRRIQRLSLDLQTMLRVAAIMGRDIDIHVLRAIDDEIDYDEWLARWHEAAVLEVSDGQWRFTHEQVRQAVIVGLAEDYVRYLHRLVAETIEEVHPQEPGYWFALADHWHAVGSLAHESRYAILIAEFLIPQGGAATARHYLDRVLSQLGDDPIQMDSMARIARLLGDAEFALGDYQRASAAYEKAVSFAEAQGRLAEQAAALRGLGAVLVRRGQMQAAHAALGAALNLYESLGDSESVAMTLTSMAYLYLNRGEFSQAEHYFQRSRQHSNQTHNFVGLTDNLFGLGMVALRQNRYQVAEPTLETCLALAQEQGLRRVEGYCRLRLGYLRTLTADYAGTLKHLDAAMTIAAEIGDRKLQADVHLVRSYVYKHMGENTQALALAQMALKLGRQVEDIEVQADALAEIAWLEFEAGREAVGMQAMLDAFQVQMPTQNSAQMQWWLFKVVRMRLKQGEYEAAAEWMGVVSVAGMEDEEADARVVLARLEHALGTAGAARAAARGRARGLRKVVDEAVAWLRALTPME